MKILRMLGIFTVWRGDAGFICTPVTQYAQSRKFIYKETLPALLLEAYSILAHIAIKVTLSFCSYATVLTFHTKLILWRGKLPVLSLYTMNYSFS